MKKRKLLVLDIDGTLTNTQKDITPKTLEASLKIEQMGHAVALASGRPTGGMRRYIGELELAKYGNYAISYNGACVTNMQTNEIVYKNVLPDYVAPWMLDYAREHDLGMCIYDGNTVVCGTRVDRYLERETVLNGFNRVMVENFDDYRGMDMFKALALGADAVLIGRPFVTTVYGGGEEGVQLYVQKLKAELADTMRMCGAHSLAEIKRSMLFGF